jgi:hypothetical protein
MEIYFSIVQRKVLTPNDPTNEAAFPSLQRFSFDLSSVRVAVQQIALLSILPITLADWLPVSC